MPLRKNATEMILFNKNMKLKGRPAILTYIFLLFHGAVLAVTLLIITLPAFCSCDKDNDSYTEDVRTLWVHNQSINIYGDCLDIFFFNDDKLRLLDSYQCLQAMPDGGVEASSRKGDKLFFAITGACIDPTGIGSYDDLGGLFAELDKELPESPVMTAFAKVRAGEEKKSVTLEPLLSEIVISSICCDFHKKPYSGQRLEDVKIYLTNVRDRCPVTGEQDAGSSFINCGALSEEDMKRPGLADLVYSSLEVPVGENVVHPDIHLYCYPDEAGEEGLGTPFTRLVIEGKLGGETTYYPITINRGTAGDTAGQGVERNKSYIYDITICRRGVSSPDIPIDVGILRAGFHVKEWDAKGERTIGF